MGITFEVDEEGTLKANISYKDCNKSTFVADTSYWQLSKASDGEPVNNRSFANGSFSGTYVVMTGDDLAIDIDGDIERIFSIKGTYSSDYGSGLTFNMSQRFNIKNALVV